MSQLRSSRKQIIKSFTGENLNRKTLDRAKIIIGAVAIQQNLPHNPMKHKAFAKRIKRLNFKQELEELILNLGSND